MNYNTVVRTERGWAGHFICVSRCLFRRNTLLSYGDIKIVISTVGLMRMDNGEIEKIGCDRYFETMAFHADSMDKRWFDADISRQVNFESEWAIEEKDADDKANDMHEAVVNEIAKGLLNGEDYE